LKYTLQYILADVNTLSQAWDCNALGSAPNPNQVFRRKRVAGALGKQ
jgi:hypothetical protein